MNYARIYLGLVVEIILPYFRTEADRPAAPPPLAEDATDEDKALHAVQQAAHDGYVVGEVPIEERFHPDVLATLVACPESVQVGDSYDGATFGPPPGAPPPTAAEVLAQRDSLLALAALRIAPLQDAVDLDEATAAEVALLKAWKQYRVALNRIESSAGFPGAVVWPKEPV